MSKVNEEFRRLQLETLEELKKRRDILNTGIADLEYAIEHHTPPLYIDFEAINEKARKDIEFLDKCEKIRKGEWVGS